MSSLKAGAVRHLQQALSDMIYKELKCTVFHRPEFDDWEKSEAGAEVVFDLCPSNGLWIKARRQVRGQSVPRVVLVFPLSISDANEFSRPSAWASWHECWQSEGRKVFRLNSAGWTLFWGYHQDESKIQIARAEWRRIDEDEAKEHPQPHWHFDQQVPCQENDERQNRGYLRMHRFHFAMGAWSRSPYPSCWQRTLLDDLPDWAINTLRLIQDQSKSLSDFGS